MTCTKKLLVSGAVPALAGGKGGTDPTAQGSPRFVSTDPTAQGYGAGATTDPT